MPHQLSSPAKAKALERALRMFTEKALFGILNHRPPMHTTTAMAGGGGNAGSYKRTSRMPPASRKHFFQRPASTENDATCSAVVK